MTPTSISSISERRSAMVSKSLITSGSGCRWKTGSMVYRASRCCRPFRRKSVFCPWSRYSKIWVRSISKEFIGSLSAASQATRPAPCAKNGWTASNDNATGRGRVFLQAMGLVGRGWAEEVKESKWTDLSRQNFQFHAGHDSSDGLNGGDSQASRFATRFLLTPAALQPFIAASVSASRAVMAS